MSSFRHQPARLKYRDNGFQIIESGGHVTCAVTGQTITLSDLRYWSVDLQEAYIDATAAMTRMVAAKAARLAGGLQATNPEAD
jgi:hypothetical protein